MRDYYIEQYEYEKWANKLIIKTLWEADSNPTEHAERLMNHILAAQRVWYYRIIAQKTSVKPWDTFEVKEWENIIDNTNNLYANHISDVPEDEFMTRMVRYENTKGEYFETPMVDILQHVLLHSAYHRGQIVADMKAYVDELPRTDYIFYVREIKEDE